jgi:hypothetical protein
MNKNNCFIWFCEQIFNADFLPLTCFSWITSLKSSPELIAIGCKDWCDDWYLLLLLELLLLLLIVGVIMVWVCNPVIQSTWSVIQETKSLNRNITLSEAANTSCYL